MAKRLTKAQRKAKARQLERHHTIREIAKDRVALIDALVEKGLAENRAKAIADTAMDRAELPGYIGDSKLRQARAAFDTAQAVFTQEWPSADDERPDAIDVSLEVIEDDEDIQIRVGGTDEGTVNSYAVRMRAGDDFPPLVVFFDAGGENGNWHLWLADGFHRYEAIRGQREISPTYPAIVYAGDRRAALEYAATCNARHGLPLSNEDKRAAVQRLLELHPKWSDREIARRLGVSHPFVGKMRKVKTKASGNDYQMPRERDVQRGDQTYTYTPPERDEGEEKSPSVDPESQQPTVSPQSPSAPPQPQSTQPDEDPRLAVVIREHLIAGDVEGFLEALSQAELDDYHTPSTPPEFSNALHTIFGSGSDAYVDPLQQRKAVRCLYDALAGPTEAPTAEAEEAKKSTFTGDTCPDCGGRIIHVSANGKPARDVCMECGALTSSPP